VGDIPFYQYLAPNGAFLGDLSNILPSITYKNNSFFLFLQKNEMYKNISGLFFCTED